MSPLWHSPIYQLRSPTGKQVTIDVTTSVSPGLRAHKILTDQVIPFFNDRGCRRIIDFGAGALRHSFPLLKAGFEVVGVEFEECFANGVCATKRELAERHANFGALMWPGGFLNDRRQFDAGLLCYVLQTMPVPSERERVLKALAKKIAKGGFLLYMSRYGQHAPDDAKHRVSDGCYKWPNREAHSFYREFSTEETQELMHRHGFERIRSLSQRGTEQIYLYHRPNRLFV